MHGSGARFPSAVHTDLSIMEVQVGQLQAQLAQTQAELQYAIEQIRILTIQVNNSALAAASVAETTVPADTSTGSHSQLPKVNHQFGKDIVPSIFDGKQRTDFREWAENSALYLSTQCVDACEILLSGWSWRRSTWRKQQSDPSVKKKIGNTTASAHSAESPLSIYQ